MRRLLACPCGLVLWVLLVAGCDRAPRWNVLLVTFDTTRADHLPPYGFTAGRTPTLDALAAQGTLFENAYASVPITLPSHTTIHSGRYPLEHGVRENGLFVVPEEVTTLAEILRGAGYRTAAAVGSYPLMAKFGLAQGFELYDDRFDRAYEDFRGQRVVPKRALFFDERQAQRVNEALYPWLEEHHDEPFFVWAHYFDPHQPLEPPPPYNELFAGDLYAGELAYADESFGTLLAHLRRLGVEERTLVIFTADHGEGRGDHDEHTHSFLVYNTTVRVPLILREPGAKAPRRVAEAVGHVDIVPTVLDLLNLPAAAGVDGRSLRPAMRGEPAPRPGAYYTETLSPRLAHGWGELRALIVGDWKYIHGPRPELYDVADDPRELDDRLAAEAERAGEMHDALARFVADHAAASPIPAQAPDAETRRRLEALGYVQPGSGAPIEIREGLFSEGVPPQDRAYRVTTISRIKDLMDRGQLALARELAAELMAEDPESPYYLEIYARVQAALGNFDEAVELLRRAREAGRERTEDATLLLLMARELARDGRREEALARVREALAIEPTAEGWGVESVLLAELGDPAGALAALERAVAADPSYGPTLVALAVRRAQAGRLAEAQADFERAVEDNPYYPRAHFNYGAYLFEQGHLAEAAERFRRAADLDPAYAAAWEAAGVAYDALGRRPEIERLVATLTARLPTSPALASLRRLLGEESPS